MNKIYNEIKEFFGNPVDNIENFIKWLLTEFRYKNLY